MQDWLFLDVGLIMQLVININLLKIAKELKYWMVILLLLLNVSCGSSSDEPKTIDKTDDLFWDWNDWNRTDWQ